MNDIMYPFIDLAVHDAVRDPFIAGDALVIVTPDFNNLIWANGAAAALFKHQTIYDFLEDGLIGGKKIRKKLREAAKQLLGNSQIKSANLQFLPKGEDEELDLKLELIILPRGEEAILVYMNKTDDTTPDSLDVAQIVSGFTNTGTCVTVLGHQGEILAATEQFYALEVSQKTRKTLTKDAAEETDRLVKRPIETIKGDLPSAIGCLSTNPDLFLLFTIDETAEISGSDVIAPAFIDVDTVTESDIMSNDIEDEKSSEELNGETDDHDASDVVVKDPAEQNAELDHEVQPMDLVAVGDDKPFVFNPDRRAVRFVWRTDAAAIFTEISPELGEAIGPNAADITGRRFTDVALVFNLHPSEEILDLIRRRDTWSGKTVMWPVQGTDLSVPVDLAALPTYTRDRLFDGYRGFGVARIQEAIEDPEAIGLALINGPHVAKKETGEADDTVSVAPTNNLGAFDQSDDSIETSDDLDPYKGELPALDTSDHPKRRRSDKVIQLDELRREAKENLTENEQAAFFEIRERLSQINSDSDDLIENVDDTFEEFEEAVSEDELVLSSDHETHSEDLDISEDDLEHKDPVSSSNDANVGKTDDEEIVPNQLDSAANEFEDVATAEQNERLKVKISDLNSILETATDGVVIIDEHSKIQSLNASASALFDYDQAETVGEPFAMLFAPESQNAVLDYMNAMADHGVASILNDGREVMGRVASGGTLPLSMTIGSLSGSGGYCAVLRDISQSKNAEQELEAAKQEAESANAHKTDFLARVSHEIRTPLNAIIGFSDMISQERFGPVGHTRYTEYAHDISKSGRHVLDIVNDLLDISKIEAGKQDMDFQSVSLNDEVNAALSLIHPLANEGRVIVRSSLPSDVPNVVADQRSIKQILLNILSNSIRHTQAGGQIVVSSSLEASGSVLLRIRDDGAGMSRAELDRAMQPFGQVGDEERHKGDGTGLGLPLTRAMTEANRAKFDIVSAPGEGTLVTINFPPQRVLTE